MLIFYTTITVVLIMAILWLLFIWPLFKYQRYASRNVRRATLSKLVDIDKNILTISSAAIILTITLIKGDIISNIYLVASWISFLISISSGVLLYVAYFTHDYTDQISIDKYKDILNKHKNDEKISKAELNTVKSIRIKQSVVLRAIFILIYFEITFLILALILLSIFGYVNIFNL